MSNPAAPMQPGATPASYPGKVLGIVGLLVSIFCGGLIGLILSIVAFRQSKAVGIRNTPAFAGIIVGAIVLVIAIIVYATVGAAAFAVYQQCQDLGPGTHQINGTAVTCS